MDEMFFKSALPAQEGLVLDDSSLPLPDRSWSEQQMRIQQQVQLTLSRKARRTTVSNGSVHLHKNATKSLDASDGTSPNRKVNGWGPSYRSPSGHSVRSPSRRVEVSLPLSPELLRFNYSMPRYGTYTHPWPGSSLRAGMGFSRGPETFRRYAFSDTPRAARPIPASSLQGSFRNRSIRRQPGFQQGDECDRGQSTVKQYQHTVGAQPQDAGLSLLSRVRRDGDGVQILNSYPHSVTSVDMGGQMDGEPPFQQRRAQTLRTVKSEKPPEMTLERAVNLLSQEDNEETLIRAAGHIQSQCFKSAEARKMVYYLHGIAKLLQLLHHDHEVVQRIAAGALRNVVYQSSENKMEMKENDGLNTVLQALKSSRDVETRRHLTGLLWNISSHDLLKERLSRGASLAVLTQSVLVPSSGISEGENPKDELMADADAFHNATGCLRNLSSAGPDGRKAMRECENLIDSLVYYIRGAVADKTDDKSMENCVCILHNLSYHMEAELPQRLADIAASRQNWSPNEDAVGCFPYRSAKITQDLEQESPRLTEKANPRGMEWLWSAITIRMYLSLMARSVRTCTREAALGALQNITASSGARSESIAFTIVQREKGLQHVKKMIEEGETEVKRTALSLVKNLSRYQELHPEIVKQVLPEVVEMLPCDDTGTDLPTEVTTTLCNTLLNLSQSNMKNVRAIFNQGALPNIINISIKDNGYGPTRAGQAACALLHSMWKYRDLRMAFKKCGYIKSDFINARTTKAVSGRD
ncbi:hypothetical protein PBY51_008973 [Eleginops maclovinus]|uniref:Plakophilin 2 n=1 Tax=Eleginops maclovinus TaxID=56733 RepID=A0AAN8ABP2_ELEMC|nr:hypothetical protein PBY51_008973 [Eleginops maclovinus]